MDLFVNIKKSWTFNALGILNQAIVYYNLDKKL